jgi:hypothetical protein
MKTTLQSNIPSKFIASPPSFYFPLFPSSLPTQKHGLEDFSQFVMACSC